MRIGVDGRELGGQPTGVGRYLQRLLREWGLSAEARAHQFTIYSPDAAIALPPDLVRRSRARPGRGRHTLGAGRARLRRVRRDRPDVFFAPGYSGPLLTSSAARRRHARRLVCRAPGVVPSARGMAAAAAWRGRPHDERTRSSRSRSSRATRSSGTSAFLPIDVHVIHLGVDIPGAPPRSRDPLVLFVGSMFNRRHVPALVQAFARSAATRPGLRLELVGSNRTHPLQDIAALASTSRQSADRVGGARSTWRTSS